MDIRCLNLQLCKDQGVVYYQGGVFAEKGFKLPCLYDYQRQLELSYQEEKANLLQGYFCTSWMKTKTYIFWRLWISFSELKNNLFLSVIKELKTRLKSLEETISSAMGKENLNSGETKEAAASVEENTEIKEEETNTTGMLIKTFSYSLPLTNDPHFLELPHCHARLT